VFSFSFTKSQMNFIDKLIAGNAAIKIASGANLCNKNNKR